LKSFRYLHSFPPSQAYPGATQKYPQYEAAAKNLSKPRRSLFPSFTELLRAYADSANREMKRKSLTEWDSLPDKKGLKNRPFLFWRRGWQSHRVYNYLFLLGITRPEKSTTPKLTPRKIHPPATTDATIPVS
jgi:hypothetical protein